MIEHDVIVFGYGKFGNSIANSIAQESFRQVTVAVSSEKEFEIASLDGLKVKLFNLESDASFGQLNIQKDTYLVCTLDDNQKNLFLALSLRELYRKNYIMAISDSTRLSNKLRMIGVNRVIDIYDMSASMIINILDMPVATKFLQGFINKEHDYIFDEITIRENAPINGKFVTEVDFKKYNIVFIGIIDKQMENQFFFGTIGVEHKIVTGDTLICVGKKEDLENFRKSYGGLRWI